MRFVNRCAVDGFEFLAGLVELLLDGLSDDRLLDPSLLCSAIRASLCVCVCVCVCVRVSECV
jgi:hypothetical protein